MVPQWLGGAISAPGLSRLCCGCGVAVVVSVLVVVECVCTNIFKKTVQKSRGWVGFQRTSHLCLYSRGQYPFFCHFSSASISRSLLTKAREDNTD